MDVSFVLSADELFTLISQMNKQTEAGKTFVEKALKNAEICDLSNLEEKNLAGIGGDELILVPVMHMLINAISNATGAEDKDSYWEIDSDWVTLHCERYPYKEEHWILSPIKGAEE